MADVSSFPDYTLQDPKTPVAATMWSSERFETTTVGKWRDLPGAEIAWNTDKLNNFSGGLVVATFTAETLIAGPAGAVGLLDITIGGQKGHPQSDNHRFATKKSDEEWGSVTTMRAMRFPYDESAVRDATVKVIVNLAAGTSFGLQNWLLKMDVHPISY
ncbi:hypothetical protein [Streptomyces anulatus]|uniref:hypothetical protein n=1 Tax=Streptomyces anulatus TaxID=1892 RepID=UPI003710FA9A